MTMFLMKIPLIHWPRAAVAQCVGYVVLGLFRIGKMDAGDKLAKVSDRLWRGIHE